MEPSYQRRRRGRRIGLPGPEPGPGIYAVSQSFLPFSIAAAMTAINVIWLVQKMHRC